MVIFNKFDGKVKVKL